MATINLTKGGFVRRVADIDNLANWNFLGTRPALIDFYASWCGPCQRLAPILERISEEFAGRVDIYKVNVDDEEQLAQAFGIRSIPTLIFIPITGAPERTMGAMSEAELRTRLNNLINR
ncbi:MAG: thioredoxin [Alistipes sp.]|nr:thioredoxin [Alistipes sp.]